MTHRVAVGHSQIAFEAVADETVLDAAERNGYALPYSCRKGVCSTCESGLRDGRVAIGAREIEGPAQVLICRAKPLTDITILPHRIEKRDPSARKIIEAVVFRLQWITSDVAILLLRFPVSIRARFKAGQYLRIIGADGSARNYSMANAPEESDGARLHIRYIKGGAFSERVLATLKQGDRLTVELPFGEFYLRDDPRPVICLATGVGFAPVLSMLEQAIRRETNRLFRVYWSGRDAEELYFRKTLETWAETYPWLTFIPVVSGRSADSSTRRGLVHEEVLKDVPDLSGHQVYASGNPLMIRKARALFTSDGHLPEDQFFGEPFVSTQEQAAPPPQ